MDSSLSPTPFDHQNTEPKKTFTTSLIPLRSNHFKEDTYFVSELKPSEAKSLQDLKHKLSTSSLAASSSMWGVPLIGGDDRADVILLKFLRARDFKVGDSLRMLEKCLEWREEFKTEKLTEEDLGFKDLEGRVAYMRGYDKEGHPVCYNAYGVFKEREMYERVFGDEEKLNRFLRWRVQVLERGVKLLHFKPGGVNSIIQDNYPEMVATKIFINVPWYFSVIYSMFSPFLTHRTKSKFVISKEGNAAETLYKPEDIPVQYGGLSRPTDSQNGPPKPASEFSIKGGEKVNIQIEGIEGGATISWDIVVGGWDLEYTAEFVPNAEESYAIVVEKPRRMKALDEAVCNSFTTGEAGKLIISVDNSLSRKKKVAAYHYTVRKYTTAV
ncbi:hypothetical protein IGI04_012365 [Brassica rapa subsp. trilocularis]|uniref:CRAL-TRIO domain-containing protein n=1 Tax=Brassica rapa subsp. trilocularis TaxID=1813537 RepID=A0ABQ7N5Q0_BRACM|nr:hypothetical protein IGI04_012365 [Brassica rapa subsp. trilocularis]